MLLVGFTNNTDDWGEVGISRLGKKRNEYVCTRKRVMLRSVANLLFN